MLEEGAALPSIVSEFKGRGFPGRCAHQKERDTSNLLNVAKRLRELLDETRWSPRGWPPEARRKPRPFARLPQRGGVHCAGKISLRLGLTGRLGVREIVGMILVFFKNQNSRTPKLPVSLLCF